MARFDIGSAEMAGMSSAQMDGRAFYELGVMYAAGRSVEMDRVTAHKWLNIAALRGCSDAVALRSELAAEMSSAEVAEAQRAARLWLSLH